MIKGVIFDFYGVFYKNLDWGVIRDRIYSDLDKKVMFRGVLDEANAGTISNREFHQFIAEIAEDDKHPEAPAVLSLPEFDTDLLKVAEKLHQNGVKVALFSNGGRTDVMRILNESHAAGHFDPILTSTDVGAKKPDAEAFRSIVAQMGLEPGEVLLIDDSPRHLAGAKAEGIKGIHYLDPAQLGKDLKKYVDI